MLDASIAGLYNPASAQNNFSMIKRNRPQRNNITKQERTSSTAHVLAVTSDAYNRDHLSLEDSDDEPLFELRDKRDTREPISAPNDKHIEDLGNIHNDVSKDSEIPGDEHVRTNEPLYSDNEEDILSDSELDDTASDNDPQC